MARPESARAAAPAAEPSETPEPSAARQTSADAAPAAAESLPIEIRERARRAFALGAAAEPLRPEDWRATPFLRDLAENAAAPPMALLAAMAHRERLTAPPPRLPQGWRGGERPAPADPRPLLPEALRGAFRRLAQLGWRTAHPSVFYGALASRLSAAGVRPHPFDLPSAAPLIEAAPELFGAHEAWWLQRRGGPARRADGEGIWMQHAPPPRPPEPPAAMDAASWSAAKRGDRQSYVAALRAADPAAARAFLETILPGRPPDERIDLIGALDKGLGPDDVALLSAVRNSSKGSLRSAAERILRRCYGSDENRARVDRLGAEIDIDPDGAPRWSGQFSIPHEEGRIRVVNREAMLDHIDIDALAERLGASAEALVDNAPPHDPTMVFFLLRAALFSRRPDLAVRAARRFHGGDFVKWFMFLSPSVRTLPDADREALIEEGAMAALGAGARVSAVAIAALAASLPRPPRRRLSDAVLASRAFREAMAGEALRARGGGDARNVTVLDFAFLLSGEAFDAVAGAFAAAAPDHAPTRSMTRALDFLAFARALDAWAKT